MGLFDFLLGSKQKALNPNINEADILRAVNGTTLQDYSNNTMITEGYLGNADVFSIVQFLARKASSIPWYVYELEKGSEAKKSLYEYKKLTNLRGGVSGSNFEKALMKRKNAYRENIVMDTPLAKLLDRPNQYQAQDAFLENLFGYRFLTGEGNIYGNDGNLGGRFAELNVLPTQYLAIYPDPNDWYGLVGYKLNVGKGRDIKKENVLMWKGWNPEFNDVTRSHMRGVSPIKAAYKTLRMSNNAYDASAQMAGNGGAKGAIVPKAMQSGIYAGVNENQAAMIQDAINTRINGTHNKGRIGVLQTPWDYLNFGLSSIDMELIKAMQVSLQQWCRVFGLPAVIFDTDTSSYNNYQNAMRDLVTNTIVPMCANLRDELNHWLLPRYGDNLFIDFDITALPEMQQDMERMVRSLRDANWLTMDEKRVAMNYDEKGGPWSTSYLNQGLIPIEFAGMNLNVTDDNSDNNGRRDMGDSDEEISENPNGDDVSDGTDDEAGS
jgi:HK97 family phage portal protein